MKEKKPNPEYLYSEYDSEQMRADYTDANFDDPDYIASEDEFTYDERKDM